jgi:teichuronic acid biosynthesis glycosyltransferase TuaC
MLFLVSILVGSSNNLRIAVVTQYFPVREQPYRGHSAYQTLLRVVDMAEVRVFAPQSQYPSMLRPINRVWSKTDLSYVPEKVEVTYFHYPALPVISRPLNGWTLSHRLKPLLLAYNPDVILSYWIYPDSYAALRIGKKLNIPVVVTAIGSDLNCVSPGLQLRQTRRVLEQADAVVTVSQALYRRAIRLGADPRRAKTIVNGCDPSIFHIQSKPLCRQALNIPPNSAVVLFVGRLDLLKGVVELVRACALLYHAGLSSITLVMIGEGPAKIVIEQVAVAEGFRERLRLLPPSRSIQIARWMAASNVFSLPSYHEGCPNVVIEALRCGCPVVATQVGGIPEMITEQNGILVPPRDVRALAKALADSLTRSWDSTEISVQDQRSWKDVAAEVYAVCKSVVAARASRASAVLP